MRPEGAARSGAREARPPGYVPASMTVDLEAVAANFAAVRRRAGPGRRVIAVLKADAYGHGAAAAARCLERAGADLFAVGSLEDAATVRAAGLAAPIVLLCALQPEMIDDVVALDLIPMLEDSAIVAALLAAKRAPVPVFVKVDCGFGRLGVPFAAAAGFVRGLARSQALRVMGLYTHFPFSDRAGRDWAQQRQAAFCDMVDQLAMEGIRPEVTQALASAGLYLQLPDRLNAVAVGSLLFGLRPVAPALEAASAGWHLRPALSAITTKLVHVGARAHADEAAPYLRHTSGPVGVIPIGIQQAYRPASPDAFVIVRGYAAPVLRACLENTVIDLCGAPDATVGADVMVLGSSGGLRIGIDDLATWQGASALATVTGLGRALARRYVDSAPGGGP